VTLRARWVMLRARWVSLRALLGDRKSSLGDAKSSLGDSQADQEQHARPRSGTGRRRCDVPVHPSPAPLSPAATLSATYLSRCARFESRLPLASRSPPQSCCRQRLPPESKAPRAGERVARVDAENTAKMAKRKPWAIA
jgi:hypothetical protein